MGSPPRDFVPDLARLELDAIALPARILSMRRAMGLTQTDLGRRLRVVQATVNRWETGATSPSHDDVWRLATLYAEWMVSYTSAVAQAVRRQDGRPPEGGRSLAWRRAMAETAHSEARRLLGRSQLFGLVLKSGGRFPLPERTWRETLNLPAKVFRGLPLAPGSQVERSHWGYDIGTALDARVHGLTYREAVSPNPLRAALSGEIRLIQEVEYPWEVARLAASKCLESLTSKEQKWVERNVMATLLPSKAASQRWITRQRPSNPPVPKFIVLSAELARSCGLDPHTATPDEINSALTAQFGRLRSGVGP